MSKACSNCGTVLEDNAAFCANCGTQSEVAAAPAPVKSKKPMIITIVAVVAALIVAGIVFLFILGDSYTTPIERAIDITFKGDFDDLGDYAPDAYWDNQSDTRENAIQELKDQGKEYVKELTDGLSDIFGSNYKVDYEINDKDSLSKGKLALIGKALEENYGIAADEVSSGYKVNLTVSIKGSKDNASATAVVTCAKIDGTWYMIRHSGENLSFLATMEDVLQDLVEDKVSGGEYDEF